MTTTLTPLQERARLSVQNFRAMMPNLNAYVRALTGRKDVRIVIDRDGSRTDGHYIFFKPPMALGDNTPHDKQLCGLRDEHLQLRCPACCTRELVLATIYHEVSHIIFNTLANVTEEDAARFTYDAAKELGTKYAEAAIQRWNAIPENRRQYGTMGAILSEYLPIIQNALEDARVNARMFEARRGVRKMIEAKTYKIFTEGVEQQDGSVVPWSEYPLNMQMILGLLTRASGFQSNFHPKVEEDLLDPVLNEIASKAVEAKHPSETYALSFRALARLREMGYCKSNIDPEVEEDEQPEPDEAEPGPSSEEEEPQEDQPEPGDSEASEEDEASEAEDADPAEAGGESDDTPGEADSEAGSSDSDHHEDGGQGEGEPSDEGELGEDAVDENDADGGEADTEQESSPDAGGSDGSDGDAPEDSADDGGDQAGASDMDAGGDDRDESLDDGASGGDGDEVGDTGESDDSEGEVTDGDSEGEPSDQSGSEGDSSDRGDGGGVPAGDDSGSEGGSDQGEYPDDQAAESATEEGDWSDDPRRNGGDSSDNSPGEATGEVETTDEADGADTGLSPDDEQEVEADDDAEPIDSGSRDEVEPIRVEYGTPEETLRAVEQALGHDPDTGEVAKEKESRAEEKAIEAAITQAAYFETPSTRVSSVREIFHDNPPKGASGWNPDNKKASRQALRMLGIEGDFEPSETTLQAALLRMRVAFSDNRRARNQLHLKSGKVNARALGKRAWGDDERLFKKKARPGRRDYSVLIAMDISGSTQGSNLILEKQAVMAQAELLHRMGIRFSIIAHSADTDGRGGLTLDMYHVKEWEEPWNTKVKVRFNELAGGGGNLDGHSLEYYRKMLDREATTDRVLMYYTDGKMPAANYDEELEILQRELKIFRRKSGYTVMAVGICTDSPIEHGLDTVRVESEEDIIPVVRHIEKRLEQG